MNYKEIIDYLDCHTSFIRDEFQTGVTYSVESTSMYFDNKSDYPEYNKANIIVITPHGLQCRTLRILNGILYAREPYEVLNLTDLKEYIKITENTIHEFELLKKEAKIKYKLGNIQKDFK